MSFAPESLRSWCEAVKFALRASEKPRMARVKFRTLCGMKYPALPDVNRDTETKKRRNVDILAVLVYNNNQGSTGDGYLLPLIKN